MTNYRNGNRRDEPGVPDPQDQDYSWLDEDGDQHRPWRAWIIVGCTLAAWGLVFLVWWAITATNAGAMETCQHHGFSFDACFMALEG